MDEIAIRLSKTKPLQDGKTPEYLVIIETKPLDPPELRNIFRGRPANR